MNDAHRILQLCSAMHAYFRLIAPIRVRLNTKVIIQFFSINPVNGVADLKAITFVFSLYHAHGVYHVWVGVWRHSMAIGWLYVCFGQFLYVSTFKCTTLHPIDFQCIWVLLLCFSAVQLMFTYRLRINGMKRSILFAETKQNFTSKNQEPEWKVEIDSSHLQNTK